MRIIITDRQGGEKMKRSREISIIVNSLVSSGLVHESQLDRARCVIKDAIKDIRRERYKEKQKNR